MLDLTGTWPRWSIVAAVAAPLSLAVVAVSAYQVAGLDATIAVLAAGGLLLLILLVGMAVRLRLAVDGLRVGERALETSRQAIFVIDALRSGQPNRYVNPAYCALTGYAATDAVGVGFDALGVFTDPAGVARLDEPGNGTARVSVRRRDGTTVTAKLELRAVPLSDGSRCLIGFLDDVEAGDGSADVAARSERATTAADLRANEAFLSALSHDLRSPLNACVMWLDVLALAPQADRLTQAVDAIKRNLARQTRLVSDLNDAAKISSGGLEVHPRPLDLVALLKSNIDAWQLLAIGKQLNFTQRIEAAAALIDADPERVSQALNHLIDNAIASTPAGGRVELRIRLADDRCVVEIEDTGVALSADDAANLGTPLWRAPASFKTRPGLGLGLAVAHHVAVRHGGTLAATTGGPGTCLTLTLPLAVAGIRPG